MKLPAAIATVLGLSVTFTASAQALLPMATMSFEFGGAKSSNAKLSLVAAYEEAGADDWRPLIGATFTKHQPAHLSLLGTELNVYQPEANAREGGIRWGYIAGSTLVAVAVVAAAGGSSGGGGAGSGDQDRCSAEINVTPPSTNGDSNC